MVLLRWEELSLSLHCPPGSSVWASGAGQGADASVNPVSWPVFAVKV